MATIAMTRLRARPEPNDTKKPKIYVETVELRLEKQKESRHRVFNSNRFHRWWSDGASDGYESDDSAVSYGSSIGVLGDQSSPADVYTVLMLCEPNLNFERVVNACVRRVAAELEAIDYESKLLSDDEPVISPITQFVDKFFSVDFLDRMSSFIRCRTIGLSVQKNILKMFETLVSSQELSSNSIDNLSKSLMVPTLIQAIQLGSDELVECSLKLLTSCLDASYSTTALLGHVLNSGLVPVLCNRSAPLKWKCPKTKNRDLKTNRVHTLTTTCLSLTGRKLFRIFSYTVTRLVDFKMSDTLRFELIEHLEPLFHQFLSCPDNQVINNAIQSFVCLIQRSVEPPKRADQELIGLVVNRFGLTLFGMIANREESIVLTIMQFLNTIIESYPKLVFSEDFASQLITALNILSANKSSDLKKEGISLLQSLGQWVDISDDNGKQLCHRLLCLLLIMLKASDSSHLSNRQNAIITFDHILSKYSSRPLVELIVCSAAVRDLLRETIETNDSQLVLFAANTMARMHFVVDSGHTQCPAETRVAKELLNQLDQLVIAKGVNAILTETYQ